MDIMKHKQWRFSLHATAKNFDLKIQGSKILPSWVIHSSQSSLLLRIRKFVLNASSETKNAVQDRRKKSRVIRLWERVCRKRVKKKRSLGQPWNGVRRNEVVRIPALLYQSVLQNEKKGIVIYTIIVLFYLAFLLKSFLSKRSNLFVVLVELVSWLIGVWLNFVGHTSNGVWMAWNNVTYVGYLYVFIRAIFSLLSQGIGTSKLSVGMVAPIFLLMVQLSKGSWLMKLLGAYPVAKVGKLLEMLVTCMSSAPFWLKQMSLSLLTKCGAI